MTFLLVQRPLLVVPVGFVGWDNRAPSTGTSGGPRRIVRWWYRLSVSGIALNRFSRRMGLPTPRHSFWFAGFSQWRQLDWWVTR